MPGGFLSAEKGASEASSLHGFFSFLKDLWHYFFQPHSSGLCGAGWLLIDAICFVLPGLGHQHSDWKAFAAVLFFPLTSRRLLAIRVHCFFGIHEKKLGYIGLLITTFNLYQCSGRCRVGLELLGMSDVLYCLLKFSFRKANSLGTLNILSQVCCPYLCCSIGCVLWIIWVESHLKNRQILKMLLGVSLSRVECRVQMLWLIQEGVYVTLYVLVQSFSNCFVLFYTLFVLYT